ncbi:MAG TPA: hypothetical protein VK915_12875 [Gaiellaceae bacterium]|nr:hypothetical protein [Gaiellaceae bacterium]
MRARGLLGLLLVVAVATLIAAASAGATEGVEATLAAPIPVDAPAGEALTVAWSLAYVDESGGRRPFSANGVFVRIRSATGAAAFARARGGLRARRSASA